MSCKVYTVKVYEDFTEWFNEIGKWHREDGPAVAFKNGRGFWYVNGKPHRLDGPAIEYADGSVEYWIEGKHLTKEEFLARTNPTSCSGKVVEIDGKKYKLVEV